MLKFEFFSKEESKIYYTNTTDEILPIKIDFIDCYSNSLIQTTSLELQPKTTYWTLIHVVWINTRVNFYDLRNNNLILPIIIDGEINLNDVDINSYIKDVQSKNNLEEQTGVHDVLKEHFHIRKYEDFIDVEEGDVVVDVGFNYGIFSLGAIKKGASKIYGFEPNKNIFEKIKKYPKKDIVEIYNVAITGKGGKVYFEGSYNTLGSKVHTEEINSNENNYVVDSYNLDWFISSNRIEKIDFLKIDCEGEEYNIFDNLSEYVFGLVDKLHVEFHENTDGRVQKLISKLEENNFNWWFEDGVNYDSTIGLIFAKKKKKNIVLISCYCDTEEKKDILKKNISKIKSFGSDVALISPIILPENIIEISDFTIIDKENPVLDWPTHAMYQWQRYQINGTTYEISNTYKDYGWAGLLHVKKLAQIFSNYNYDYFFFSIYDIKLDEDLERLFKTGYKKKVFPSKRDDIVWQVGLHLMCFDKINLKKLIDKINFDDYISYIDFDAFLYLHKHIVEPLKITIGKRQIEDEIYYHEKSDNLNHSPDKKFRFFVSSPDPQSDTVKIFFNGDQKGETITIELNDKTFLRQISFGSVVDLGLYKNEIGFANITYRDKTIDLYEIISNIKNSNIRQYD